MSTTRDKFYREVPVYDNFSKKALAKGGFTREQAIRRAESALARLEPDIAKFIYSELKRLDGALLAARRRDAGHMANIKDAYEASGHIRDVADPTIYSLLSFITTLLCRVIEISDGVSMAYPGEIIDCFADALLLVQSDEYRKKTAKDLSDLTTALEKTVVAVEAMAGKLQKQKPLGHPRTPDTPQLPQH
jgi:hypothetical protein